MLITPEGEQFIDCCRNIGFSTYSVIPPQMKQNELNIYLLVTGRNMGCDISCIKVKADRFENALSKFYDYFGGTMKTNMFAGAIQNRTSEDAVKLFQNCTGETVLYFGVANHPAFIDEVHEIEGDAQ